MSFPTVTLDPTHRSDDNIVRVTTILRGAPGTPCAKANLAVFEREADRRHLLDQIPTGLSRGCVSRSSASGLVNHERSALRRSILGRGGIVRRQAPRDSA